jgi:hypothetical protein
MTVGAHGEYVLGHPRDLDVFAAMWCSYQLAVRWVNLALFAPPSRSAAGRSVSSCSVAEMD